jgi:UDP-N-acetylmuramoyl-tripeptide--D-alanyl-D-alanine ligase
MRSVTALWTSADLALATGGVASADFSIAGVAFDSREVGSGDLFIALTGEVTDGHHFVDGAFAQGAAGAIVSQPVGHPHILVSNTVKALDALGVASRARTQARIAGVTGSVGKTGTKEALASALARANRGDVHRSVKSYNNHTGVPLSLARMPAECRFGVFEMGMNHAGELSVLTQLVRPHVAIVTTIAAAHIEFFDSIEGIADAKAEIFEGLEPGGTAIIPFDSPFCSRLSLKASSCGADIVTFGTGEGADVRALDIVGTDAGTKILARLPDGELSFTLAYPGKHWVSNAMAVLAGVKALGGDLAAAGLALGEMEGLAGRGARHQIATADGDHALLIDESYNANPTSMAATLSVLGAESGRRIAVLGEMRELGSEGEALHAGLAEPLVRASVDFALLVGPAMAPLAQVLEGQCDFVHAPDAAAALDILSERIQGGDVILVKGSNAVGLGRIVSALIGGNS